VQDEVDQDAIEMREVPPAVEQVPRLALNMDARDELDHDMLPELELERVPHFALNMEAQDEYLTCNVCDQVFHSPHLLHQHQVKHRHWGCSECWGMFETAMERDYHTENQCPGRWTELELERMPRYALDVNIQDELDHDMLPELEVEQVPLALTHDAKVEDYEPRGVEMGEPPEALTYEPEEQLTPLPIGMQLQEPRDEIQPYEVLLPISSSSSDTEEDDRPRAIGWSGHLEAGGSRLQPRPVVHPEDAKWIE